MSPKPVEFYQDQTVSTDDSIDIEAGISHPEPVLSAFNQQVEQIQSLITNSRVAIVSYDQGATNQLEYAEKEVRGAFKQLSVLAMDNHKHSCTPSSRRTLGTMRIVHFTKCTQEILHVIAMLDSVWMKRHEQLSDQLSNEIQPENEDDQVDQVDLTNEIKIVERTIDQLRELCQNVQIFSETQDTVQNTNEIGFAEDFLITNQLELESSLRKSRKRVILLVMIPLCVLVIVGVVSACFITKSLRRQVSVR